MKFLSFHDFFGHSTGHTGKIPAHRTIKKAEWKVLPEDSHFNGFEYAKGSKYKVFETQNFGWVVFAGTSLSPNGLIPGRFIHKY